MNFIFSFCNTIFVETKILFQLNMMFLSCLLGGTSTGVMKHVGEAVAGRTQIGHNLGKINCIGVAPWGQVDNAKYLISKVCVFTIGYMTVIWYIVCEIYYF